MPAIAEHAMKIGTQRQTQNPSKILSETGALLGVALILATLAAAFGFERFLYPH